MEVTKQPTEVEPAEVQVTPAGQMEVTPTQAAQAAAGGATRVFMRALLRNGKGTAGALILIFFALVAIFAPLISPGDPTDFVGRPHQAPSAEHWFGTEGQGKDVFAQTVWGARNSLAVGFATGLLTTIIGVALGMTAGYFGGRVDDVLSLLTNVVLIIPGLPLLVVLASFLKPGMGTIILVLSVVGWAWGARVIRSQTLSLREKDFASAAIVSGESHWRIIFRELMPNLTSLIVGGLIGAVTFAIGAETALSFLGLTNVGQVSWGTNLYWAQNNAGLLVGAWWTIVPSGLCVALVAFALSLINYAMDEITNPRLRAEKELSNVFKSKYRRVRATPVVRDAS
jgi:peptide/nickel transport system permease protein